MQVWLWGISISAAFVALCWGRRYISGDICPHICRWVSHWEGIVIGKYALSISNGERQKTHRVIEVLSQNKSRCVRLGNSQRGFVHAGDYVTKNSLGMALRVRACQAHELKAAANMLTKRLSDSQEVIRLRAVDALAEISRRDVDAISILTGALSNDCLSVRLRILESLTKQRGHDKAVICVLRTALNNGEARVRMAAEMKLMEMKVPIHRRYQKTLRD